MYIVCTYDLIKCFETWLDAYCYALNMRTGAIINYNENGFWRVEEFERTYKATYYCVV